jgi:outer membrane protein assembly factor BamB
MRPLFFPLIALFIFSNLHAQIAEFGFRGPLRDGIYPAKGLSKIWPAEGLPLAWTSTQIGKGYSSPVAANGKVYVGGLSEDGTQEVLTAFSSDGTLLWQTQYGTAWEQTYPESRSTPTVVGDDLYIESGKPEMVCVDAATGAVKWTIDAVERYNRKPTEYGPAESPLVVGNVVYFTTMSDKASLIAVNRKNGEVIWETPPFKGDLMYASPIFIEHRGKKQIIIINEFYVTGIDQSTGAIAWQTNIFDWVKAGVPDNKWRPQFTNTPIYKDGKFCIPAGYDYGTLMLQLNDDATSVSQLWINRDLDPHHGGVVLIDGYLYGSTWTDNNRGNWCCVDWNTGKTQYENTWTSGNKGSIVSAENMLYCVDDKRGNIALLQPTPDKFEVISSFRITQGSGPYWAHPTISNGNLYFRHGEALMVYGLK